MGRLEPLGHGVAPRVAWTPDLPIAAVKVETSLRRGVDAVVEAPAQDGTTRAYRVAVWPLVRTEVGGLLTAGDPEVHRWVEAQGWSAGVNAAVRRWEALAWSGELDARAEVRDRLEFWTDWQDEQRANAFDEWVAVTAAGAAAWAGELVDDAKDAARKVASVGLGTVLVLGVVGGVALGRSLT